MTTAHRLTAFAVAVVATFGAGVAIGTLVGPVGPTTPMNHSTGLSLSQTNGLGR